MPGLWGFMVAMCTLRGHSDCLHLLIVVAPSHGMVFLECMETNPLLSSD